MAVLLDFSCCCCGEPAGNLFFGLSVEMHGIRIQRHRDHIAIYGSCSCQISSPRDLRGSLDGISAKNTPHSFELKIPSTILFNRSKTLKKFTDRCSLGRG